MASNLLNHVTLHISADAAMEAPEAWRTDIHVKGGYVGFRIGEYGTEDVTVWIDFEAMPRLCHLLTELYARRPQERPAPHTLAEADCRHCDATEGSPHVYPCPVLSLAEDR